MIKLKRFTSDYIFIVKAVAKIVLSYIKKKSTPRISSLHL